MVDAVGIESARERNFNDLQRSRWHDVPYFRCKRGASGTGMARISSMVPFEMRPYDLCPPIPSAKTPVESGGPEFKACPCDVLPSACSGILQTGLPILPG